MTPPKLATVSIAAVVVLGAVFPLLVVGTGPAGADHAANTEVRDYHAVQDDRCVNMAPLGDGEENVTDFYDYQSGTGTEYASYGTQHLQENQVSQFFVYHGPDGVSLVFVHDALVSDDDEGGVVYMEISDLPAEGEWVVVDDDYGNDTDDDFVYEETRSEMDWVWAPGRTDGGAYRGLSELESDEQIRIDPAFSEDSPSHPWWPYSEDNLTWQAREDEDTLVSLDEDERVSLGPGACDPTPPDADLTADPSSSAVNESVTLDASASYDEGDIVEYRWDLDRDGETDVTTTSDATLNHSYPEPGTYTAAVTVTDDDGENDTTTTSVTVTDQTDPDARANVDDDSVEVSDTITFDGTNSTDNVAIDDVRWEFDDGAVAQNATATHAYAEAGTYEATLVVTDTSENTDNATVAVTVAEEEPDAVLDAPGTVASGADVTLDASDAADPDGIDEYRWDLDGDDEPDRTTSGPTTEWSESAPGDHTVGVTVEDGDGHTDRATATIEVRDTGPSAAIDANETTVDAGTPVAFDASASVNATSYEWDFGDGETATGETVTHTYDDAGTYDATVTVGDENDETDTATTTITVEARDDDGDDGSSGGGSSGGGSSGGGAPGGSIGGAPSGGASSSDDGGDASVERVSDGLFELRVEDPERGEAVSAAVPGTDDGTTDLHAVEVVPSTDANWLNVTLVAATDVAAPNGTDVGLVELDVQGDPDVESLTYQFGVPHEDLGGSAGEVRAFADDGDGWTSVEHTVVANDSTRVVNATTDGPDPVALAAVRPMLSVESIEPDGTPTVDESATVEVVLANDGHVAANRSVEFAVDGDEVETRTVSVPARETRTLRFRTTFDAVGERDVTVAGTTQAVPVAAPGANVSLTDVSLPRNQVSPGEEITVVATFENTGDAAGTAVANFTVVDDVVDVERASVAPGEEVTVRFEESIDAPGNHSVGVNDEQQTVTVSQAATPGNDSVDTATDSGPGTDRNSSLYVAGFAVLVLCAAALSRVLS